MNPNRLVLDFMGIRSISSMPVIGINEIGIVSIRSALNRPGVARVVFNFTEEIPQYRIEESESGLTLFFWKEAEIMEQREPQQITREPIKPPIEEKKEEKVEEKKKISPKIEKPIPTKTEPTPAITEKPTKNMMSFGISSGFLTLQDDAFRDAYGEGGIFYKGEYSFYLPIKIESIDIWTGVTFFQKNGQTTLTEEELKLRITTFSLALRYLRKLSRFTPFVGIGIDYIVYKETYPEDFIVASVGGSDLGFHAQAGTYIDVLKSLSIKVHIKYNLAETTEDVVTVNLGGIEYGIGLVFRFNL
jgi:opacity protein-like surface antigen